MKKLTHTLIATARYPEDGEPYDEWDYSIDCPVPAGEIGACSLWDLCGCSYGDVDDDIEMAYEDCPHSPTGEHRYFYQLSGLCMPRPQCWVATHDNLYDAACDLGIQVPGAYLVDDDVDDEIYLMLDLIYPEETRYPRG